VILMGALLSIPYFDIVITVFLGAVFGSFASMLAHRSVAEDSWLAQIGAGKRSFCPSCGAQLGFSDLIPVLSWLMHKGKCAHCTAPIGQSYLAVELGSIAMCLGILAVHGLDGGALLMMLAVPLLLALLVADIRHMILPDILIFALGALGALHIGWLVYGAPYKAEDILINYGVGGVIYGALLWGVGVLVTKMLRKEALGFGDVKYFVAAGLWLGLMMLGYMMIFVGVAGMLFAFIWRTFKQEEIFPFGPALIISTYILFLIGGSL